MLYSTYATNGMVVAPHHLAAKAGLDVLRDGGNAIEAMVAAAAAIAVVYPHMNAIGGDGFWIIASPDGDPVAIDCKRLGPATLLTRLNEVAGANGVGRVDIVENRFVGMKSRGVYETPGGTVLLHARRAVESLTLDRGAMHLKDELMPRYAELVYNGFWFAPERHMLQAAIDDSQRTVNGTARIKLYKGNVTVLGRKSPNSLYDEDVATFEADSVYDQHDAEGFIKLNALRLRLAKMRRT